MARIPATIAALALAVGLAGAGCGADTEARTPTAAPIAVSVEQEGLLLTLEAAAPTVASGDDLFIGLTVMNVGPGVAFWQGGGCGLRGHVNITGGGPTGPEEGRDWAGDHHLLKEIAVADGIGWHRPPDRPADGPPLLCPASLGLDQLPAGEAVAVSMVWAAVDGNGGPVVPGPYELRVSLPFLGRQAQPPFDGDISVPTARIPASLTVDVTPTAETGGPPAWAAMDAILADPRFDHWLAGTPRNRWDDVRLEWRDGGWRLEFHARGPLETLVATVDARSGSVSSLEVSR